MKVEKSYIIQSLAIIVMASGFFLFFKGNLPKKIFSEEKTDLTNVVIDSLLLEAFEKQKLAETENSTKLSKTDEDKYEDVFIVTEEDLFSDENEISFKGMAFLDYFFSKLYQVETDEKGRARIAYYGDSMTDGDMIVQDLRKNYQDKYGGSGVGFIQITSESAGSRGSVIHKFSSNWQIQSYMNVKRPLRPFGVSGQVFFQKDSIKPTWVSYQASKLKNLTSLNTPTLYFGRSNNKHAKALITIGSDTITKKLEATTLLNKLKISNTNINQVKIQLVAADSIPFYGIDVSSANGVQVDNFSTRGNSGLPLSLLNVGLMQQFQKDLDYSLIILHYGTNVLNYGSYNYGWYTKQMSRVVAHLRQCFPKASILVISTADKSSKYDLTMQTDSAVNPLVKAQRKYAMESKAGFFNLYEAMGGKNSMVKWVEEMPARANKDYTHFNFRGAQAISKMIYNQLEEGYVTYKKKKEDKLTSEKFQEKRVSKEAKTTIDTISNEN